MVRADHAHPQRTSHKGRGRDDDRRDESEDRPGRGEPASGRRVPGVSHESQTLDHGDARRYAFRRGDHGACRDELLHDGRGEIMVIVENRMELWYTLIR